MFIEIYIGLIIGICIHIHLLYAVFIMMITSIFIKRYTIYIYILIGYMIIPIYHYEPLNHIDGKVVESNEYSMIVKEGYRYSLIQSDLNLAIGTRIQCDLKQTEMTTNRNFNEFNYANYMLSKKVYYAYTPSNIQITKSQSLKQIVLNYMNKLEEPINSYAKQLLIGIKDEYTNNLYDYTSSLSIVHLFALSGMHLQFFIKILDLLHLRNKHIKTIVLSIYTFMIGNLISLYRAFLFYLIKNYTKIEDLDNLVLVGILLLLYNPYYLYSSSYVFSMGLSFVVLFTKDLKHAYFYQYLGSIPFILYYNYSLPMLSLLYQNFFSYIVEGLYGLLWLSLLRIDIMNQLIHYYIKAFEYILVYVSKLNIEIIFKKPSIYFLTFYMMIWISILILKSLRLKYHKFIALLFSILICFYIYSGYQKDRIVMIDVGQGDCFLYTHQYDSVLIDTGGNHNKDVATKNIIPYLKSIGVKKLDYVLISHDDFDHSGALASLKEHFKIDEIVYEGKDVYNFKYIDLGKTGDKNDDSNVYLLNFNNYQFLFTGDISMNIENKLIDYVGDIDVLKVSHHGSNTGTSTMFLNHIRPEIALISCGVNNRYKHPSSDVLMNLEAYGVKSYVSRECGMVEISFRNKELSIKKLK